MGGTTQGPATSSVPGWNAGAGAQGMNGAAMGAAPSVMNQSMGSSPQFNSAGAQMPISERAPGFASSVGGGSVAPIAPAPGSPASGGNNPFGITPGHGGPG